MKYRLILGLVVLMCSACSSQPIETSSNDKNVSDHEVLIEEDHDNVEDNNQESTSSTTSTEILQDKDYKYVMDEMGHKIIIVNKKYPLSSNYAPGENPEAKAQLLKIIADMQQQGFDVSNQYSGYRSYEQQAQLYNDYVSRDGVAAADRYSARPGHSEHQTGLAYDLLDHQGNLLGTVNNDGAAEWLAEHAHEYGFIVRYLPGKEEQTGYMPEAWHLRYVGDIAKTIYQSHLSLEEYFGVDGGTQYEEGEN